MSEKLKRILMYISVALVAAGCVGFSFTARRDLEEWVVDRYPGFGERVTYFAGRWLFCWFGGGLLNWSILPRLGLMYLIVTGFLMLIRKLTGRVYPDDPDKARSRSRDVILALSFIPALIILIVSTYYGIHGTSGGFITPSRHGMDAFWDTLLGMTLLMCMIPALPAAVAWQVYYFIKRKKK